MILLIGWDAADWDVLDPLLDAGLMPNLARMVDGGCRGRLATLDPPLSPMLWTSIATGKRPYKHGVHGFVEKNPSGPGVRPIRVTRRHTKAVWNIFQQNGQRVHTVGWWPSHPAEPLNGHCVSNLFQQAVAARDEPWPLPTGAVHPESQAAWYARMRVHPGELTAAHLAPFVPDLASAQARHPKALANLAAIIAENATLQAAATYLLEFEPWDFLAVYFDGPDHVQHGFMKYHPPYRPGIPEADYELFKGVVTAAYRFQDQMLGRLLDLAGPQATVLLVSDHGFRSGAQRPFRLPDEPAGPAFEHAPYGIFVAKGPGIRRDELVFGASLLDVAPTLLALAGLPVGEDMDGRVLGEIFSQKIPDTGRVPSWDEVPGDAGLHLSENEPSDENLPENAAEDAFLQRLDDLGYLDRKAAPQESPAVGAVRENRFYLAQSYLDGGLPHLGIELLETLVREDPEAWRYKGRLLRAYLGQLQLTEARQLLSEMQAARPETAGLRLSAAQLLLAEGKNAEALESLNALVAETGGQLPLRPQRAQCLIRMRRLPEALVLLEAEVDENQESAEAFYALGIVRLLLGETLAASDAFLEALDRKFYFPMAHYHYGEANWRLDRHTEAEQAFRVAIQLAPALNRARLRLAQLCEKKGRTEEAENLRRAGRELASGEIVVVSGLPRSGTSMMMQMLVAGGIPAFSDGDRKPDQHNPHGYWEHRAVLRLSSDQGWLPLAFGKAVKIVAPLLPWLPPRFRYKIIFMERPLNEVLVSQGRMLGHDEAKTKALPLGMFSTMEQSTESAKAWMERQPSVTVLPLSYPAVLADPAGTAKKIADFLEKPLDINAMAAAVLPTKPL